MKSFFYPILVLLLQCGTVISEMEANLGSLGTVRWFITPQETITVTMEISLVVPWLAIGWHTMGNGNKGMLEADIVAASFDSHGFVTVADCVAAKIGSGHDVFTDISVGGRNDIFAWSGTQAGGKTIFTFQRKLVTNDTISDNPLCNGNINIIWAHGIEAWPSYHGPTNRFMMQIDFFTGSAITPTQTFTLQDLHGSLMIVAFAICMIFGIFVSRYLKDYHWWFPLHIIIQVMAVGMALVAFAIALIMVPLHFSVLHSWFGLSVISLSVITPAVGWAGHLTFDPNRISAPIWPDQLHWWLGRFTVVLAFVTIILGMRLLGLSIVFQAVFGSLPALFLIIFVFIEIYRRIYSHQSQEVGSKLQYHTVVNE